MTRMDTQVRAHHLRRLQSPPQLKRRIKPTMSATRTSQQFSSLELESSLVECYKSDRLNAIFNKRLDFNRVSEFRKSPPTAGQKPEYDTPSRRANLQRKLGFLRL